VVGEGIFERAKQALVWLGSRTAHARENLAESFFVSIFDSTSSADVGMSHVAPKSLFSPTRARKPELVF
jgi:hypothetical protein